LEILSLQQVRGLVKQHIESFDYFLTKELQNILEANQEVRSEVRSVTLQYCVIVWACLSI